MNAIIDRSIDRFNKIDERVRESFRGSLRVLQPVLVSVANHACFDSEFERSYACVAGREEISHWENFLDTEEQFFAKGGTTLEKRGLSIP